MRKNNDRERMELLDTILEARARILTTFDVRDCYSIAKQCRAYAADYRAWCKEVDRLSNLPLAD